MERGWSCRRVRRDRSGCVAHASTICAMWMSISRAMRSSCSQASPDPASRRWSSGRCMPRRSVVTSNRSRPMRVACWIRLAHRISIRSRDCHRRWRCANLAPGPVLVHRWGRSPRSRTCRGCSSAAPVGTRVPMLLDWTRTRSRRIPSPVPAPPVTGWAWRARPTSRCWCPMIRCRSVTERLRPGRERG